MSDLKILIVKEKHGDRYFDASTDEALWRASHYILKRRHEEGWYVEWTLKNGKQGMNDFIAQKLTEEPSKIHWLLLQKRNGGEYEDVCLEHLEEPE